MLEELEALNHELNRPGKYNSAISSLKIKSKMAKERKQVHSKMTLDRETLRSLATALKSNQDAIEALEKVTKKVGRTVNLLDSAISDLK